MDDKSRKRESRALERHLKALDPDREKAAEIYVGIHNRLVTYFRLNRCPGEEDLADEVFYIMSRYVRRNRIRRLHNPRGLAHRIAEKIKLRVQRTIAREPLELTDATGPSAPASDAAPDEEQPDDLDHCSQRCLKRLASDERRLILRYEGPVPEGYLAKNVRKQLAKSLGISPKRLNRKAFEIRRRLLACIESCRQTRSTKAE